MIVRGIKITSSPRGKGAVDKENGESWRAINLKRLGGKSVWEKRETGDSSERRCSRLINDFLITPPRV